jgi:hypothetical protein
MLSESANPHLYRSLLITAATWECNSTMGCMVITASFCLRWLQSAQRAEITWCPHALALKATERSCLCAVMPRSRCAASTFLLTFHIDYLPCAFSQTVLTKKLCEKRSTLKGPLATAAATFMSMLIWGSCTPAQTQSCSMKLYTTQL